MRTPLPRPASPDALRCPAAASGNIAPPSRSRLPVSTLSTSTSQLASVPNSWVQVPIRAYTAAARRGRQLARHAPDLAGLDAAGVGDELGREVAHHLARPRRARRGARRAGRGRPGPPRRACRPSPRAAGASVPGRMKWCSSASSAVRVRRGSTTTTLPPRSRMRAQPPAHVGRGQQAAVRDERVGAQDQQVVGAVDVRAPAPTAACPNISPELTCLGIWSTVEAE